MWCFVCDECWFSEVHTSGVSSFSCVPCLSVLGEDTQRPDSASHSGHAHAHRGLIDLLVLAFIDKSQERAESPGEICVENK
jgi:hypothetical protein